TLVTNTDGQPDPLHLSVLEELRSQLGDSNVQGVGTLAVSAGSAQVLGTGTAFTADDVRRRIIIAGKTFVIATVSGPNDITLEEAYAGASAEGLPYSLGAKLVGQPWEVKVPTNLVKLDQSIVFS